MPAEAPPAAAAELFAAIDATWPAAEVRRRGPWTLRRGDGGGNRASAASFNGTGDPEPDIAAAEAAMRAWGQVPLFMIRPGDEGLDAALARRGYAARDHVALLAAPTAALAPAEPDPLVLSGPAPLAVMAEIWARGGIGPERLAVMARAAAPRAFLLGRTGDRPAGCAFVAVAGDVAMLHALEVAPASRRKGVGAAMTRAAAGWAVAAGAPRLALAVARANAAGCALYAALGMAEAAAYHYRATPD
jgi:N-acetylglutamate synthase